MLWFKNESCTAHFYKLLQLRKLQELLSLVGSQNSDFVAALVFLINISANNKCLVVSRKFSTSLWVNVEQNRVFDGFSGFIRHQ